jgi:thiol-disulfide isomerase/thioredoxin
MMSPINRLLIGAILAGSAAALLLLGLHLGPRFMPSGNTTHEPTLVPVSPGSSAAGNPLALSIFDQPRELPAIRFSDAQHHELTLGDFRGRVILLNIWATWCVPCREEMPALDRLQAELGGEEFLVIPLSIDRGGGAAVKRFYEELKLEKLGIYVDPSGRGSRGLALPGVPTTLLIDREGREVGRKMGAAEWDSPQVVALVQKTIHADAVGGGDR